MNIVAPHVGMAQYHPRSHSLQPMMGPVMNIAPAPSVPAPPAGVVIGPAPIQQQQQPMQQMQPVPVAAPPPNVIRPVASRKRMASAIVSTSNSNSSSSESTDESLQPPRPKVSRWMQPLPDTVEVRPSTQAEVTMSSVIYVQPWCSCPNNHGRVICTCNPMLKPPYVIMPPSQKQFDLLDIKWAISLQEQRPMSILDPNLHISVIFQPIGKLPSDALITCSAELKIINRSSPSQSHHNFSQGLENITYRPGDYYNFPLDKNYIFELLELNVPQLGPQYLSFNIDFELKLTVKEHSNISKALKFKYAFDTKTELTDLVMMCDGQPFFVDCSYLRYYSQYFEITRQHMASDLMTKKHSSGLPMVDFGDEIDAPTMEAILNFVYPCRLPLPTPLLLEIVRVSDRLMMVTVKEEAERSLMSNKRFEFNELEVLQTAFTYNLESLKDFIMDAMIVRQGGSHPAVNLANSLNSDRYIDLSPEVKIALLDRLMKLFPHGNPPQQMIQRR